MPKVRVNPVVSAVCTALYLAECVWAYFVVRGSTVVGHRGEVFFAVAMFGVMCMLNFSKFVGRHFATACGANKLNARKFGDQVWQFVIHVSMTIVEVRVLADETWYSEPPTAFAYHAAGKEFPVKPDVQWLYAVQLSIWIITCFSHHFLEARHKDYVLMYTHHIVTIALILLSWCFGFQAIGVAVLYVHDASDITIDLLKMFNYLKLEGPSGFFAVEIVFVLNLVSWAWWRVYQLPFRIVKACIYDGLAPCFKMTCAPQGLYFFCACSPFIALLIALCLMHMWWLYLLLRIAYKLVTAPKKDRAHNAGKDEYEGSSDDESKED